ncbi:NADH dehydrogenase [ubiquinone] 1 alpha subcomplex subunit 5 isoform X2 [Monodelphis domestica]|uniref:NADH dehydrogenase [ubiquinone] 1 alpha subcomplex subunit 5 n=1 Tax=Monodelphis domestica TaxID=13616 RepID=A0A5F8H5G8_MONDO|nr:NADH dehydrogenase [ubiquinone] 1 alpha subcomplex subunit 5 isoform X2 [Monodelphis domestica]
MAGVLKKTTGLVGLAVCETPRERLKLLYDKILNTLQLMPANAAYRKYTEQITNERMNMVKEETDLQKLEDQLQSGQLEEVILQAENELSLARKMLIWKPWEPLLEEPPANQWKWPL